MAVSVDAIKHLREKTGAPIGDVKAALEACQGNEAKAVDYLKRKGFEAAQKRQGRTAKLGRVEAYIHHDGRVGALVEVNCETDFVSRLPEFQQLCRDVAMQVASQQPATAQELVDQPFIKDQGQTIGQYVSTLVAKTGENIVVKRFVRFGLGEER
jgi:elongation factor Ts